MLCLLPLESLVYYEHDFFFKSAAKEADPRKECMGYHHTFRYRRLGGKELPQDAHTLLTFCVAQ